VAYATKTQPNMEIKYVLRFYKILLYVGKWLALLKKKLHGKLF